MLENNIEIAARHPVIHIAFQIISRFVTAGAENIPCKGRNTAITMILLVEHPIRLQNAKNAAGLNPCQRNPQDHVALRNDQGVTRPRTILMELLR